MTVLYDLFCQFPVKPRTFLFGIVGEIVLKPLNVIRFKGFHTTRLIRRTFIDADAGGLRYALTMFVVVV